VPSVAFQAVCRDSGISSCHTWSLLFLNTKEFANFFAVLGPTSSAISLAHAVSAMRIVKSSANRNISIQAICLRSPHCGVVFPSTAAAARGHAANRQSNNSVEVCIYDGVFYVGLKLRKNCEGRRNNSRTCQEGMPTTATGRRPLTYICTISRTPITFCICL
jgi:hypothetical protein